MSLLQRAVRMQNIGRGISIRNCVRTTTSLATMEPAAATGQKVHTFLQAASSSPATAFQRDGWFDATKMMLACGILLQTAAPVQGSELTITPHHWLLHGR